MTGEIKEHKNTKIHIEKERNREHKHVNVNLWTLTKYWKLMFRMKLVRVIEKNI